MRFFEFEKNIWKNKSYLSDKRLNDFMNDNFFLNVEYFICIRDISKEIYILHNANISLNGKYDFNDIFMRVMP